MEYYKDVDGDSNIEMYEIGPDFIIIKFYRTERLYTYTYESAGRIHVENMKKLAKHGNGLNSYVIRNCKSGYVK